MLDEVVTLHYNDNPVRVQNLPVRDRPYLMVCLNDIAAITGISVFDTLGDSKIKEFIMIYKNIVLKKGYSFPNPESAIINIESSNEIYVYPLIAFRVVEEKNISRFLSGNLALQTYKNFLQKLKRISQHTFSFSVTY